MNRARKRRWIGYPVGALFVILAGIILVWFRLGAGLSQLSYDLPFLWRPQVKMPEVVLVYLDRQSQEQLGQTGGVWDRTFYVGLLKRLARDQARLVFMDIILDEPREPETDLRLAEAMREHGRVILGGSYSDTEHQTGDSPVVARREQIEPLPLFAESARDSGLLMVSPDDGRSVVRRIYTGTTNQQSAVWAAARQLGADLPEENRLQPRFMNYYGAGGWLDAISLSEALDPTGVPPDYFRDKLVFVGGHPALYPTERFTTPFSRFGVQASSGVELMATAVMNLSRGEWITRMPTGTQLGLVIGWGALISALLMRLRPWHAAWVSLLCIGACVWVAFHLQWQRQITFAWLVPAAVQIPLALLWALGFQYVTEYRQKLQLRRAFSSYLSPELAERIAASEFDLALGGEEVEATILFTDLEGFTDLSETLSAKELSKLLTTYFTRTTRHILEHSGTIIKYIGDAVMAVWGAPLPDDRQAERAVMAAIGMREASRLPVAGRQLRTRIGINTGTVVAGNLGSDVRFDYTAIGAATNLASRLENLNKMLGTDILITEATRRGLGPRIATRFLGRFRLRGIADPVHVHEVLGVDMGSRDRADPNTVFEAAVAHVAKGDRAQAEILFQQFLDSRKGSDGPAQLYLRQLTQWRDRPDWFETTGGVIDLTMT